jgi:hypothetical protein
MSQNESSKIGDLNEINEQASQADSDDTVRRGVRGDETKGDADERDAAGGVQHRDTPHGREEAKNDTSNKANTNG